MTTEDYWNTRAEHSYEYKKETFYTITLIPLYYYRRKQLLKLLSPLVADPQVFTICDFGCGDGWYMRYFDNAFPGKVWTGVDVSQHMIERAYRNFPDAEYRLIAPGNVVLEKPFDLISIIAVFAHILDDEEVVRLFACLSNALSPARRLVIFEQTAPVRIVGESYCRRLSNDYVSLAKQSGLILERRYLIHFPAHVFFERRIAPVFYSNIRKKGTEEHERRIRANSLASFRILSRLMIWLSYKTIWPDDGRKWGNSFIVFRKP